MQFCVSLAVIVSFAAADLSDVPVGGAVDSLALRLAGLLMGQLLVPLVAIAVTSRTITDANLGHLGRAQMLRRLDRGYMVHHIVWLFVAVGMIVGSGWISIVTTWWTTVGLSHVPLLVRLSVVMPVLVPLIASWACFYDAELVVDRSVAKQSRWQFVLDLMRGNLLLPLFAVAVTVGWVEAVDWLRPESPGLALLKFAPLFLLVALFPYLLRLVWKLKPLPPGELRIRLEKRIEASGIACRDILIWHTGGRVRNAAMAGFLRQFRFVLLTDRLVDDLEPDAIECVVLHELGHAHHAHSARLLLSVLLVQAPGLFWFAQLETSLGSFDSVTGVLQVLAGIAMLAVGLCITGMLARLMEHQADAWASEAVQDVRGYLTALAIVSGADPTAATWLHPSLRQRCRLLAAGTEATASYLRSGLLRSWLLILVWSLIGTLLPLLQ